MAGKKMVPAIRFAGFTDAWEQRKLGDIFEEYTEKGHAELPALTIIQGGGTIRRDESERNLQYDKASLAGYKMVNAGDFIVHLRSFEGGLERATTLGIISPAYHTFHGEGTDSRFYYTYFRSHRFINKDLKPHVYGIRDGRSIDIDGMKTIDIPYTSVEEQKEIGDFVEHLDNLITLHQRKQNTAKQQSFLTQPIPYHHQGIAKQVLPLPFLRIEPVRMSHGKPNSPNTIPHRTFCQKCSPGICQSLFQLRILRKLRHSPLVHSKLPHAIPKVVIVSGHAAAQGFDLSRIIGLQDLYGGVLILKTDRLLVHHILLQCGKTDTRKLKHRWIPVAKPSIFLFWAMETNYFFQGHPTFFTAKSSSKSWSPP